MLSSMLPNDPLALLIQFIERNRKQLFGLLSLELKLTKTTS